MQAWIRKSEAKSRRFVEMSWIGVGKVRAGAASRMVVDGSFLAVRL